MSDKHSRGYKKLTSISGIEIDVVTPFNALQKARSSWRKFGTSTTLNVDMNVYGPELAAKVVAEVLNSVKLFLQPPEYELRCLRYANPQYLKLPNVSDVEISPFPNQGLERTPDLVVKEVSFTEIEAILDHLPQPNFLRQVFIDGRVTTPLQRCVNSSRLE
jgi:SWI/SNF-related matrix-associated actin-dependent regulator of chromatin subfamily A3